MEFLETASVIEERTLDVCRKWPKSWMFFLTQRTIELASNVYEHAQAANAIMPTTEREREERCVELQRALGALYAYAQKIELAYRKFPICGEKTKRLRTGEVIRLETEEQEKSSRILEELMNLCLKEEDALKGNLHYTRSVQLRCTAGQSKAQKASDK